MTKYSKLMLAAAGVTAVMAGTSTTAFAQSADALIDKLVDKGILSVKEANELRNETDKNFTTAMSTKNGMPEWVTALKFNGDVRGRYESFYFDNPAGVDRQRFRYRMRFGATANLLDDMEVGMRLTSSEAASGGVNGGDPISGNTTMQDNGAKKFVYLDLAYAKWSPIHTPDWSGTFTIGKMENPFVFSDMVFDADYTPEGLGVQLGSNLSDKHSAKFNAGAFVMDEIGASSKDPYMVGAQLRLESKWSTKVQTSFGVAALAIANDETLNASRSAAFGGAGGTNIVGATTWTVPNQNGGNSRSALAGTSGTGGNLLNNFNPIVVDGSVTYTLDKFWHYNAAFPIRLAGEYMNNLAASDQNSAYSFGLTLGKSGKRGLWDLSYRYKYLEGDSWYEELTDSDFGAYYQAASVRTGGGTGYISGTNVKGHVLKATYSPFDSLTLGITAFFTDLIEKSPAASSAATTRIQMDAQWKF
jgi:hypothetical protein